MTRVALVCSFLACLASLPCVAADHENWPTWRGPRSDGTSLEENVPTEWDGPSGKNIVWKTEVPGVGHASPIVWDERIFTITCDEDAEDRLLLCFDRRSGKLLWQRVVVNAPLEKKHRLNSYASSTPATDGELVYVSFFEADPDAPVDKSGSKYKDTSATPGWMVVAAYDFEGNRRWLVRPGAFSSCHGYCSPPLLFDDLVILNGDHDGASYLVALDRATGETVWKVPRKYGIRSYTPPIIRQAAGRTQMVLSGSRRVSSYDPRTGRLHWWIEGPTEQYVASLVYNGRYFFLTAGFPTYHAMAIRPDGSGDVTETAVVWHTTKGCAYVPSPIIAGGGKYYLVVSDNGLASCFEAETGHRYWMERIGPHYSASLVEAEGLVHFLSDEGVTKIIRPGPEFDVVAENRLGENCYASPAISHGHIYLRGEEHLVCIGP